jgi:MFS family permease
MIGRSIRVILGFVLACLAAGATMVLFIYSPAELAAAAGTERLTEACLLALAAATHSAVFAAPFALVGAVFGERQRIGTWIYYVLVAMIIAVVGFFAQYWTEPGGDASIVNNYAATAFLVTGFVAGLAYWLVCGRSAGHRGPQEPEIEVMDPPRPAPPKAAPGGRAEAAI